MTFWLHFEALWGALGVQWGENRVIFGGLFLDPPKMGLGDSRSAPFWTILGAFWVVFWVHFWSIFRWFVEGSGSIASLLFLLSQLLLRAVF